MMTRVWSVSALPSNNILNHLSLGDSLRRASLANNGKLGAPILSVVHKVRKNSERDTAVLFHCRSIFPGGPSLARARSGVRRPWKKRARTALRDNALDMLSQREWLCSRAKQEDEAASCLCHPRAE